MQTFREQLRAHRERHGLSQKTLARECGLDHSLLCRLESGEREPTPFNLDRLSRALTLPVAERDALYLSARVLPPGLSLDTLARLIAQVRVGDLRLLTEDAGLLSAALDLARIAREAA